MPVVIGLDLQLFADGLCHEQALLNQPERRLRRHPGCDQGRLRRHPQITLCHGGMRGSADLLSKLAITITSFVSSHLTGLTETSD